MSIATQESQENKASRQAAGEFVRGVSAARASIGDDAFPAESGRYHLYVSFNCPWCHRVALARTLLGLEDSITMDVLFPNRSEDTHPRGENLWQFLPEGTTTRNGREVRFSECTPDTVNGKTVAKEIYEMCGFEKEKSVPILFDKKTKQIVNNESAEILRMLGKQSAALGGRSLDLYPSGKEADIDTINEWVYTDINNGAYKAGFSSNQEVYETAFHKYFAALERADAILAKTPYLVGDSLTEADIRLFPTVFRHDPIYFNRFKLNQAFVRDAYPSLFAWVKRVYNHPGVARASPLDHMKQGYFGRTGNGVIPLGPLWFPQCLLE